MRFHKRELRREACDSCNGKGTQRRKEVIPCDECSKRGWIMPSSGIERLCPKCKGAGEMHSKVQSKCKVCQGRGYRIVVAKTYKAGAQQRRIANDLVRQVATLREQNADLEEWFPLLERALHTDNDNAEGHLLLAQHLAEQLDLFRSRNPEEVATVIAEFAKAIGLGAVNTNTEHLLEDGTYEDLKPAEVYLAAQIGAEQVERRILEKAVARKRTDYIFGLMLAIKMVEDGKPSRLEERVLRLEAEHVLLLAEAANNNLNKKLSTQIMMLGDIDLLLEYAKENGLYRVEKAFTMMLQNLLAIGCYKPLIDYCAKHPNESSPQERGVRILVPASERREILNKARMRVASVAIEPYLRGRKSLLRAINEAEALL